MEVIKFHIDQETDEDAMFLQPFGMILIIDLPDEYNTSYYTPGMLKAQVCKKTGIDNNAFKVMPVSPDRCLLKFLSALGN